MPPNFVLPPARFQAPDPNAPKKRIFDGFRKTTGKKTVQVGFRIFEEHADALKLHYPGNGSALIRILLTKYFSGELPGIELQYKQLVKANQDLQNLQGS